MSLTLDKSTWNCVAFGDVVRNVNTTVRDLDSSGIDRVIAMEHLDPGDLKINRWGTTGNGTTFTRRVKPGQTLFGKRRAYQRKVAYVDFDAICSGDILTFEADASQLLPEFLPFLVQSDGFFDHALGTSAGSLSPRTNWGALADFEFDLPPLDEQKRIADLLWAMERHRNSLDVEAFAVDVSLNSFLGDATARMTGDTLPIADLCESVIGGVWGVPEGEGEVDVLALGPRVYTGNPRELSTAGSPVRSITSKQAEARLIEPGDIILERSGGSPTQPVGRVVMAGSGLDACIPTDFQRLLRPDRAVVVPEYLFWRLRHDWATGATGNFSKKTTNISNLSVKEYLARPITVPPLDDQHALIRRVRHFELASTRVASEGDALSTLRSALLTDIFGGN
jgi:type I restriction enzyme, S subunit